MTVSFAPGDANSPACVDHKSWRNHRLVVYGSGNNVVIHSLSLTKTGALAPSLQTIYAERDVSAVAINPETGLICAAYGPELVFLRPVNEYMTVPKWSEASRVDSRRLGEAGAQSNEASETVPEHVHTGHVHYYMQDVFSLRWASSESELAVGAAACVLLLHVEADYAGVSVACRWRKNVPSPADMVDISPDASKIIAYNTNSLDHFAKVWMRVSYGENSLFELAYADHAPETWLVDVKWRGRAVPKNSDSSLQAMANIRDLRTFLPSFAGPEENCILFTVNSDGVFHVWATCDFNGHSYLKLWARLEMPKLVNDFRSCVVLETSDSGKDLLLVVGGSESCLVQIMHLDHNPPNSVAFEPIAFFPTEATCVPKKGCIGVVSPVRRIRLSNCYMRCSDVVSQNGSFFFLCTDAIKSTVRVVEVRHPHAPKPRLMLAKKFSGHSKSVTRLFSSSTSYSGNILLSVSRFASENYIWEPVSVAGADELPNSAIAISKRFCINLGHDSCILSAVLINDVFPATEYRRHLAVVVETGATISFWDCNGITMDESDAGLVSRLSITHAGDPLCERPQAFFLEKASESVFVVVAVYSPAVAKAWRVCVQDPGCVGEDESRPETFSEYSIEAFACDRLPGEYDGACKVSGISTFLEKDLSVIDQNGILRVFAVSYTENGIGWRQVSEINTSIRSASFIHGASVIGKVAVVDGSQLTIWDCTSGVLEYSETFPAENGPVKDLDWTFTGDTRSTTAAILSVGFARTVLLYTQLRYDYTNKMPTFTVVKRVDVSDYTTHEIGDSIWLENHFLVVSSGNQFFIEDGRVRIGSGTSPIDATVQELLLGYTPPGTRESELPLSDVARILNGPLPVYHPQFLIQALLMGQEPLVRRILVTLLRYLRHDTPVTWNLGLGAAELCGGGAPAESRDTDLYAGFPPAAVALLLDKLATVSLPLITRHQQSTLRSVVKVVSHTAQHAASLDANGLKFVFSFQLFRESRKRASLNMRDVSWALHSDQKEMLFGLVETVYDRMSWDTMRRTGIVYWVDRFRLEKTLEAVARNEFADSRDPSGRISVLFLALGKKQVLVGLWKTVSHPEKDKMLKFLANDFDEPRWKSAAAKNAFVLLGKHRYLDAAAFFLLAGKVSDCCMIICGKLQDSELALAVARVNNDAACVQDIIERHVLPSAVEQGDRWMTSWAFWQMKKKVWSIQALLQTPYACVQEHISHFSSRFQSDFRALKFVPETASFLHDDPVLGVLYSDLRKAKSTYLEGAMGVSPQMEFDFVTKLANIYSRMGCDYLSVILLSRWRFLAEKPTKEAPAEVFSEFSARRNLVPPTHDSAFTEPDMSAFDFGF